MMLGEGYPMIDVKKAVLIAKQNAADILDQRSTSLEEIEKDAYKGREVWSITLSYRREPEQFAPVTRFVDPLQYKRFLVDSETGDLHAIQLREFADR